MWVYIICVFKNLHKLQQTKEYEDWNIFSSWMYWSFTFSRLNFMLTPDFRLNLLPQWFGIRTMTITEIFIRNYYRLERKVKFRFIKLSYKIAPLFSSKTTILFGRQLLQTESIFILLFILKCDFIFFRFSNISVWI